MTSKKHIRICRMCKIEHLYCVCEEYKHLEPWHIAYCSANCKDIDGILSNYGAGLIDAEQAYEQLKDKDISRKEFWGESFRNAYDEILEKVGKKPAVTVAATKEEPKKVTEPEKAVEAKSKPEEQPKTVKQVMKSASKKTTVKKA